MVVISFSKRSKIKSTFDLYDNLIFVHLLIYCYFIDNLEIHNNYE